MKDFGLFIVSVILFVVFLPIALLVKLWVAIKHKNLSERWFLRIAIAIDKLGNVVGDDLFNVLLINRRNPNAVLFGTPKYTISNVLGLNERRGNLTLLGRALAWILNTLDAGHTQKYYDH